MSATRAIGAAALALIVFWPTAAAAAQPANRYAVIVSGANGGDTYSAQYGRWRDELVSTLTTTLTFEASCIDVLFDGADAAHAATAANVRRTLDRLRTVLRPDDLLIVFLIGHGTFDGEDAKFNLVGPDLAATAWASLLRGLPGRLVVVNAAAASAPFLDRLAGPRRVIVTATDSAAQKFDTVFPGYFVAALRDPSADLDKNGRISVWEAFSAASLSVRRFYESRGQLATERALLDDDGDGRGRESGGDGTDGSLASQTYLDADAPDAVPTDTVLIGLLQKRQAIEADLVDLEARRQLLRPDEYQQEFERLVIALARVSREIRKRT